MRFIGPNVSATNPVADAQAVGATGFAFFSKSQLQWLARPLEESTIAAFKRSMKEAPFGAEQVLPHAGYLINLANTDESLHEMSVASFIDEMYRCEQLGLTMLNIHPGAHLNKLSVEAACDRVAQSLNTILAKTHGVTVVLENTAGQGSYLGSKMEELHRMIEGVEDKTRIGFCLDTAHSFGAGFDIRTRDGFLTFIDHVDATIGLSFLRGMHLNDSKVPLASHKDRHESLGKGLIGWEPFETIARDSRFENIPLILETPDGALWADEIKHLLNV
ncbi:MAG: deoxyribonuclease IV [Kiritimatiellia bacterium]